MMRRILFALILAGTVSALAQDQLSVITRKQPGQRMRNSSGLFDPESNADAFHIDPGETVVLADLDGPGEIRHIWFTIGAYERRYPRTMVFRIYWDGSALPSVETPLGDFFAAGNGMRANVSTLPIEVTSYGRALNCYWKMPFARKARLTMTNEGAEAITSCYFYIDWAKLDCPPGRHASTSTPATTRNGRSPRSRPYTLLQVEGDGQYVGSVISLHCSVGSWFGESDDHFYIDGERGTEPRSGRDSRTISPTPGTCGSSTQPQRRDHHPRMERRGRPDQRLQMAHPGPGHVPQVAQGRRRAAELRHGDRSEDGPGPRAGISNTGPISARRSPSGTSGRSPRPGSRSRSSASGSCPRSGSSRARWRSSPPSKAVLRTSPGLKPQSLANRTGWRKMMFAMYNDKPGAWIEMPFTGRGGRAAIRSRSSRSCSGRTASGRSASRVRGSTRSSIRSSTSGTRSSPGRKIIRRTRSSERTSRRRWASSISEAGRLCLPVRMRRRPSFLGRSRKRGKTATASGSDGISVRRLPWGDMSVWYRDYLKKEEALFARKIEEAKKTVAELAKVDPVVPERLRPVPGHRSTSSIIRPAELNRSWASRAGQWPYFKGDGIPLDPWGQKLIVCSVPGRYNPGSFDVWSVHGNSRDPSGWIGNWPPPAPKKK